MSASITSRLYNTTVSTVSGSAVATNSVNTTAGVAGGGSGDLTASNNGTITASLTGTGATARDEINGGIGNFIGASAIGAAAAASISQIVADNPVGATITERQLATLSLPANSVTTGALSASNSGSVSSQIVLTGLTGLAVDPSTQLGVGNAIAAQAAGASASASISSQMYGLDNNLVPSGPATPATNTRTTSSRVR